MDKKLKKSVNRQIQEELFSSYLYLSMAAYCSGKGLKGFERWFIIQAQEEVDHGMGFFHYLSHFRENIQLLVIKKPTTDFKSLKNIAKATLKHEKYITGKIKDLKNIANDVNDKKYKEFNDWYLEEQKEEEENAQKLLEKVNSANTKESIQKLDRELGERNYHHLSPFGEYLKSIS